MEELKQAHAGDTVVRDSRDAEVGAMLAVVLCSLVDKPEALTVLPLTDASGTSFQVHAAPEDVGKLIGKGGRTARAIRTILSGNAAKYKRRYSVDFGRNEE